ncbi:MAG: hypothetical protein WCG27_13540, partial [Pseudomonadota bacterium]
HKLSTEAVAELLRSLQKMAANKIPFYLLSKGTSPQQQKGLWADLRSRPGILVITVPGILCELYQFYGHVWVGGGHGRSIHSVMEPYWAGAQIFCGPKVHRSTEFDFVKKSSPQFIHIVEYLNDFYPQWNGTRAIAMDIQTSEEERRKQMAINFQHQYLQLCPKLAMMEKRPRGRGDA